MGKRNRISRGGEGKRGKKWLKKEGEGEKEFPLHESLLHSKYLSLINFYHMKYLALMVERVRWRGMCVMPCAVIQAENVSLKCIVLL